MTLHSDINLYVFSVYGIFCVCNVCAPCQCSSPQRASDPLKLEVQMTVSHRVNFGNRTWVIWKSSQCHLSGFRFWWTVQFGAKICLINPFSVSEPCYGNQQSMQKNKVQKMVVHLDTYESRFLGVLIFRCIFTWLYVGSGDFRSACLLLWASSPGKPCYFLNTVIWRAEGLL